MQRGKIPPGRATEPGPLADFFYTAVAGGPAKLDDLRHRLGYQSRGDVIAAGAGLTFLDRQVIDYLVYGGLAGRKRA